MASNITVSAGSRQEGSPYQRGMEAAGMALEGAAGNSPSFAMILGGGQEGAMEILRGVREVLGSCPMIGCISQGPGEVIRVIKADSGPVSYPGPMEAKAGVNVLLFSSRQLWAKVGVGRVPKGEWEKGLAKAFQNSYIGGASLLATEGSQEKSLVDWYLYRRPSLAIVIMICRPSESRAREEMVVEFLRKKFRGKVPVLMFSYSPEGGLPLVIADDKIVREGVVMAIIKTDLQFALERFHNFEPLGVKLFPTRCEGRRVLEFNGHSAMEEYLAAVGERNLGSDESLTEMSARHPLAYRGREGRYHLIMPEEEGIDGSILMPVAVDPDLPMYPMAFMQSAGGEFYGARMASRDFTSADGAEAVMIIKNIGLADQPPTLEIPVTGDGRKSIVIEAMSSGRFRTYLPDEYLEGEASHLSLLLRGDLDPMSMAAYENARLLGEVFRLKELNQKVFDGIGYGICVLDAGQRVVHCNNTYRIMMGTGEKDLDGRYCPWREGAPGRCSLCVVEAAINGGAFSSLEVQIQGPEGKPRWVRIDAFPLRDAMGNIESAIEVIRDISEIKKLQLSLEKEKRKMEAVVEGMAETLYIVDRRLELQLFHRGTLAPSVGDEAGYLGRKCYEAIFNRETPCPWCRVKETFAGAGALRRVAQWRGERGEDLFHQITFAPWRDHEGEISSAICLLVDITAQRRLEQKIIQSEKLSSLAVLSAGMAHELNNPLGAINFNLEILKRKQKETESIEILDSIKKDMGRINRIVGNLLSFSRKGPRSHTPIRLIDVIDNALELMRPVIDRSHVEVVRDCPPDIPPLLGNAQDLQQVFINLVSNAVDAMPAGGMMNIRLRADGGSEMDETSPEPVPAGPGLSVRLSDTGMGIPSENLARIFDPFFTTKPETQGTGLGLSVVHKILENHGATIKVESQPGEGTTFDIRFPSAAPGGSPPEGPSTPRKE